MVLSTGKVAEPDAGRLRAAMVERLARGLDALRLPMSDALQSALLRTPRHLFTPGIPLEQAYANESIITKTGSDGLNLSAVSAPGVISGMLAQAGDLTGKRVLEIGSGGYNAALLRELVGPAGEVTTLDIDPEVMDRARTCLDLAGYHDVRTVCRDGEFAASEYAPFDLIIVTVGVWDVAPEWVRQLAPNGRLVLPLRTRGLTRSWALDRDGDRLVGTSQIQCGFVPVQGIGEHRGRSVTLDDAGVSVWLDELGPVDTSGLAGVLTQPRAERWTGVTLRRGELWADQDLWLLATPQACQMTSSEDAVERGVVAPSWRILTPALADGDSLAYRARLRPLDDPATVFEIGAFGHGPRGADLAEQLAEEIRGWERARREGAEPRLTVVPARAPGESLPDGYVIAKRHSTLVLSWDRATSATPSPDRSAP
ncbi:methyltransferase, FxLD system [Pseudofrankia sp. BMG5.36]|uniref:methyltransferase, FxLD system n=1 Tax=Pseudofrankia sp. BMG5.36 TaxID=1834512 RepID=UPI0008D9E948|nr:methyltransferase, FxLD system [Pseudofrankia sp. BMG5.36]OHV63668.1 methyltransferase, FxLD system [Pseudofrankia sp. BMG5.36]